MNDFKRLVRLHIHPFSGFGEIVEKKLYSMHHTVVILLLLFISKIFERQLTGFQFNYNNTLNLNILLIFAKTVVLFILWAAANWSITTLFDGKGTFKQVIYISAISLIPYTLSVYINVVFSNFLINNEGIFLSIVSWVGIIYSVFLALISLMIVHDYTLKKTVWSSALSIGFIIIILFLSVIIFSLFQQVYSFFKDIVNELTFMS